MSARQREIARFEQALECVLAWADEELLALWENAWVVYNECAPMGLDILDMIPEIPPQPTPPLQLRLI